MTARRLSKAGLPTALVLAVLVAACSPAGEEGGGARASRTAPPRRPNVVILIVDSLRADHLSAYGYARRTSPYLDRLAEAVNAYDNQIWRVDRLIEEIRAELAWLGRLDDTLLIVTSDHGEGLGQHSYFSHGLHLYEEQLRIPLVESPGRHPERQIVAQRRFFSEDIREVRGDRFAADTSLHALRGNHPLKYLRAGEGAEELYDLSTDPYERRNLAEERPEDLARMRVALEELLQTRTAEGPIPEQAIDEQTREALRALGYVQ